MEEARYPQAAPQKIGSGALVLFGVFLKQLLFGTQKKRSRMLEETHWSHLVFPEELEYRNVGGLC